MPRTPLDLSAGVIRRRETGVDMRAEIPVEKLREKQSEAAAEVLARAFHDQPSGRFWSPNAEHRMRVLRARFLRFVRYCLARGEPWIAAGREIAGVALWMPPDAAHMTTEDEREFGLDQLSMIFGEAAFGRYKPMRDLLGTLHDRDMAEAHWYLASIGVEPSRQGTGVGGGTLTTRVRSCRRRCISLLPGYNESQERGILRAPRFQDPHARCGAR